MAKDAAILPALMAKAEATNLVKRHPHAFSQAVAFRDRLEAEARVVIGIKAAITGRDKDGLRAAMAKATQVSSVHAWAGDNGTFVASTLAVAAAFPWTHPVCLLCLSGQSGFPASQALKNAVAEGNAAVQRFTRQDVVTEELTVALNCKDLQRLKTLLEVRQLLVT